MLSSSNSEKAETISLRLALSRVADLQNELAASASRVENAVSLLLSSPVAEQRPLVDLQELDLARQSLENLGRLLATLAHHVPDHVEIPTQDVRTSMNLGALVGAVLKGTVVADQNESNSGEVHLFDFG